MNEISETELVTRSHSGTAYVCRMCYDNRHKIILVKYISGGKHEIIYVLCDACVKIMKHCSTCKKPAH